METVNQLIYLTGGQTLYKVSYTHIPFVQTLSCFSNICSLTKTKRQCVSRHQTYLVGG